MREFEAPVCLEEAVADLFRAKMQEFTAWVAANWTMTAGEAMTLTIKTDHPDAYACGYTDCAANPGPGGWACILQRFAGDICITERELSGGVPDTTNNRMELMACLRALQQVRRAETAPITLRSDSRYLIDGITKNLPNWKARGWKLSAGKPVKNTDLWEKIDTQLAQLPPSSVEWVRGHTGDPLNERVDTLAKNAAEQQQARR